MKTQELRQQGFTVLAFSTTHQLNAKKIKELKFENVEFRTRATKNYITEYYTKSNEDANKFFKFATNS